MKQRLMVLVVLGGAFFGVSESALARSSFCVRHPHAPHCVAWRKVPPPHVCQRHPGFGLCKKHTQQYRRYHPHRHHHHRYH